MKMIIEVSGGAVVCITATQECSIYMIDHDNLKQRREGGAKDPVADAKQAMQPDTITWEEGFEKTPQLDSYIDEALSEYLKDEAA